MPKDLDPLGLHKKLSQESRVLGKLRARARTTLTMGKASRVESRLAHISAVEKGLKAGILKRVLGKSLPLVSVALTAYEVAQATKEGVKAIQEARREKRVKEYAEKHYGSVAKAIQTRHSMNKGD